MKIQFIFSLNRIFFSFALLLCINSNLFCQNCSGTFSEGGINTDATPYVMSLPTDEGGIEYFEITITSNWIFNQDQKTASLVLSSMNINDENERYNLVFTTSGLVLPNDAEYIVDSNNQGCLPYFTEFDGQIVGSPTSLAAGTSIRIDQNLGVNSNPPAQIGQGAIQSNTCYGYYALFILEVESINGYVPSYQNEGSGSLELCLPMPCLSEFECDNEICNVSNPIGESVFDCNTQQYILSSSTPISETCSELRWYETSTGGTPVTLESQFVSESNLNYYLACYSELDDCESSPRVEIISNPNPNCSDCESVNCYNMRLRVLRI